MANDNKVQKKVFSGESLGKLIADAEDSSKVIFDNPNAEFSLAFFLLVRKAFNDAYDKIKEQITESGIEEIGTSFSGLTGSLVRGTHSERGGAKFLWTPTGGEEIDPEFVKVVTSYKVDTKAVEKYNKMHGELPPGITINTGRKKSLSLSPTKEAKALFERKQNQDSLEYELDILEIEE